MKALSLLQPCASLCVLGEKKVETRSWNTKHRGELLIHASAGKNVLGHDLYEKEKLRERIVHFSGKGFSELPFGAIIGKVDLLGTFSTNELRPSGKYQYLTERFELTDQELAFGDYSPNRYAWLLSDPVIFDVPIPFTLISAGVYSAAFYIFYFAKCKRKIIEGTLGMHHKEYVANVAINSSYKAAYSNDHCQIKNMKCIDDSWGKDFLKKKENKRYKRGFDLFFTFKRMQQIFPDIEVIKH